MQEEQNFAENAIVDQQIPDPLSAQMQQEDLDSERKDLEEEWVKICKKEYQLFENVKNKEELLNSKKQRIKELIKERYELEYAQNNNPSSIQINVDNESYHYIKLLEKRQES